MDMKELRESVDLSTVDIAYNLGVSESTVRNWDCGRTLPTFPINEVPKVLKLFNCTLDAMASAIEESREKFNKKKKNTAIAE
jgi:putative transcriptional regulator